MTQSDRTSKHFREPILAKFSLSTRISGIQQITPTANTPKGRYTLPVRTGRKERPYVRPVRTGVIFLRPYVRPVEDTRTIPEALFT